MPAATSQPRNPLNWWTKRKLYRLAHYLLTKYDGVHARSMERYRERTHTDTAFSDWAADFRVCGMCGALDDFYLQPDNSYRSLPLELKSADRSLWKKARQKRGLIDEGQRIMRLLYD